MKKKILFLSFVYCLFGIQIYAQQSPTITVWVHGTYPIMKVLTHKRSPFRSWIYNPFGLSLAKDLPQDYYFYKLACDCHEKNAQEFNIDHFYLYGWYSSHMRPRQRINEGRKLAKALQELITEYKKTYDTVNLRLVGVSHGGNVILNCIHNLPEDENVQTDVVLLATPIQESTRIYVNDSPVHRVYSFYSDKDWMQKIDAQKFHHNAPRGCPFWSQRTFLDSDRVIQIRLKINDKFIGHGRYRSIAGHLPMIMKEVEQQVDPAKDIEHINLNFKM